MRTDTQIQQDVLGELEWDTRVEPTDVGVTVHRGIVTLTGTVSSFAKKLAAASAAHRVHGVLDVANDLRVKVAAGATDSDSDIAAAVRHALEWNVLVPHEKIRSTVTNGLVMLEGKVAYPSQREDAARVVGNLTGVRGVDNRLQIEREPSSVKIREAITDALERRADRDAGRIQVDVEGGRVTLHGAVHSWMEREAVVGAARGTRGVESVIDRLRLG